MHFVDMANPSRVEGRPCKTRVIFESGGFEERGYVVRRVELRLYRYARGKAMRPSLLITSFVDTDKGSIEMAYDENPPDEDALERTADFVASELGPSALIVRSLIALSTHVRVFTKPAGNSDQDP